MDFSQAILTRSSIRKYTGEKIDEAQWDQIFRFAFAAPSAHNLQPWHFIRIDAEDQLGLIAGSHPYAKMVPEAGGAILVCGDSLIQKVEGFLVEDCSAAIQNMLTGINGLGLGGVWIGVYPVEQLITRMCKLFDLPSHIIPIGLIAVGHKQGSREPIDKFKPERIHRNTWL